MRDNHATETKTPSEALPTPIRAEATCACAAGACDALRYTVPSRLMILPHEDEADYGVILSSLRAEYQPVGATEEHLVCELAGTLWRKRRVLLAEGAAINEGLRVTLKSGEQVIEAAVPLESGMTGRYQALRELVSLTSEEAADRYREAVEDLKATREAAAILRRGGRDAYGKALKALRSDSRDWWKDQAREEELPSTAAALLDFIEEELEPCCVSLERELCHRERVRTQLLGEGFRWNRLESITRYETHLDRKFERTLAVLLKVKEVRGARQ